MSPKGKNREKKNKRKRRNEKTASLDVDKFEQSHHRTSKPVEPLAAKTEAQGHLIHNILSKTIVFAVGPAGTGKTYVEAAMAAEALANGDIEKLILARPMQECDEEMGFLPGNEDEKFAPWVEPIMAVLEERLGASLVKYMVKNKVIQAKPLGIMRGGSYKNSWMILDEAQNATPTQMKMFLTRIGEGSKIVINGDKGQSDLKDRRGVMQENGLSDALSRLKGVKSVGTVLFERSDVVRHPIIQEILERYEG